MHKIIALAAAAILTAIPLFITGCSNTTAEEENYKENYYTQTEVQAIVDDVLQRVDKVKTAYPNRNMSTQALFEDAFLWEAAMFYYNDYSNKNWTFLNNTVRQSDNYQAKLNTQDKIVVLTNTDSNTLQTLNLYKINGKWLTDESYTIGQFDEVPAILPFSATDIHLPESCRTSPADFIAVWGQPITSETGEFLFDTDYFTYNYNDFSITWLDWFNSGNYVVENITSGTEDFWPEIRGIRPGDTMNDVIQKFHHCKPFIQQPENVSMLYGAYMHLCDFGLIEENTLVYTADNILLRFTFNNDKLTTIEYQLVNI